MDLFSDSLDRLKHYLRVSKDQEVASALGLSKTAFSERKKRGSFPIKEVFALAARCPELGIDPDWVVTGSSHKMETADSREASLVQCFRKMDEQAQQRLLQMALLWAGEMELALPKAGN